MGGTVTWRRPATVGHGGLAHRAADAVDRRRRRVRTARRILKTLADEQYVERRKV
jgi:hypothetical protein